MKIKNKKCIGLYSKETFHFIFFNVEIFSFIWNYTDYNIQFFFQRWLKIKSQRESPSFQLAGCYAKFALDIFVVDYQRFYWFIFGSIWIHMTQGGNNNKARISFLWSLCSISVQRSNKQEKTQRKLRLPWKYCSTAVFSTLEASVSTNVVNANQQLALALTLLTLTSSQH